LNSIKTRQADEFLNTWLELLCLAENSETDIECVDEIETLLYTYARSLALDTAQTSFLNDLVKQSHILTMKRFKKVLGYEKYQILNIMGTLSFFSNQQYLSFNISVLMNDSAVTYADIGIKSFYFSVFKENDDSVSELLYAFNEEGDHRYFRDRICYPTSTLIPESVESVRMAALVHDLGKIYIPAEILNRPGRINDLVFNMIKTHSDAAYNILKNTKFPWPIADIVRQHHEKLDGSGYPDGLKDNQILLEAKILCVADVVEAMASHRPYRAALGNRCGPGRNIQKQRHSLRCTGCRGLP
jgi:hypothetical protein